MAKPPRNQPNKFAGIPKTTVSVPRSMEEITAENEKLCSHAGKIQYQIFVLERDLKNTNDAILNVNYEAAERQKLDAKKEA